MNTATTADTCTCAQDGYCDRYKRQMVGQLRAICRGEGVGVDADTAQKYRDLWASQAMTAQHDTNGTAPLPERCPFAGEEVKEDGKAKTRDCPSCNGHVRLKLICCLHPAREPEEVTEHVDCRACAYRPRDTSKAKWVILKNDLSPGDVLAMTAAIRSLHMRHPNQYRVAVESSAPAIFEHSADVVSVEEARKHDALTFVTHYNAIHQCNERAIHFMQAYCESLEEQLGGRMSSSPIARKAGCRKRPKRATSNPSGSSTRASRLIKRPPSGPGIKRSWTASKEKFCSSRSARSNTCTRR
jgi:hypothetical protein